MQDLELNFINFTYICAQYQMKELNHIGLNSQTPDASLDRIHLREIKIMARATVLQLSYHKCSNEQFL